MPLQNTQTNDERESTRAATIELLKAAFSEAKTVAIDILGIEQQDLLSAMIEHSYICVHCNLLSDRTMLQNKHKPFRLAELFDILGERRQTNRAYTTLHQEVVRSVCPLKSKTKHC